MKAVILVAGRGTRMKELTEDTPKPMLMYKNKNLIEHKIDILPESVEEIILVTGYLKDVIKNYFGNEYKGKKITYVDMEELTGTGGAVWLCKEHLKDKFIVMMGDDIYSKDDIEKIIKEDWAVLVYKTDRPLAGGNISVDENNNLLSIEEGSIEKGGLIYTGLCVLQPEIFNYELVKLKGKEEWGLPQTVLSATKDHDIKVLYTTDWINITSPEDLK